MTHITLIRHGQANAQAKTEGDYDRLSPLGHQQAAWLGAYLRDTRNVHARLYSGTLRRHRETADSMRMELEVIEDPRLNELQYFTMAQALEAEHGIPVPTDPSHFVRHLPQVMQAWEENRIKGAPEPFGAFEARIAEALAEIGQGDGPALVVAMRLQLKLDVTAMSNIALSIMNCSMHRLFPVGGTWSPVMFNAVPHLEAPDRHHAQTHV